MIDISKCNKAAVVKALYDSAHAQGFGVIHYKPEPLTLEEAERELSRRTYFDYLHGRVMKIEVGKDSFDERLYDRDNGHGSAYHALKSAGLVA